MTHLSTLKTQRTFAFLVKSVVHALSASASVGSLLERQNLWSHLRRADQNLHVNKTPRKPAQALKSEQPGRVSHNWHLTPGLEMLSPDLASAPPERSGLQCSCLGLHWG